MKMKEKYSLFNINIPLVDPVDWSLDVLDVDCAVPLMGRLEAGLWT